MNIAQIENNLQEIIQAFNKETFIYDLLLAYGLPKASITKLKIGSMNLSKMEGEIIWKKKLFFRSVDNANLHEVITLIKGDDSNLRHEPRFIIVTDFEMLLAVDTKTADTLDIPVLNLTKHYDFFLPWAGMEKAIHQNENPADVKAAERMAKLYDEINKDNPVSTGSTQVSQEEVHHLNVFLSRLLFCFFAEDTGIFDQSQFTHAINNHTQADGSDLNIYLDTLFAVMNTSESQRSNLPDYLSAFPYVNGGLFRNEHKAPVFSRRSRQMLIENGDLDWSAINPDIFGSMIQAVITPEHRGGLGMHYTSVPNIMKVIEPLFLNELREEFDTGRGSVKKLTELLKRIWNIKIFDPACGSGNFLIIAYKELRRLEMRIYKELDVLRGNLGSGKLDFGDSSFSKISLNHFYGIELDDFAHEVATLSLWLAEHQMNQEFFKEFGRAKPALPLMETGKIVHGNATRLNWELVCPKLPNDEIYILGNPPYIGSKNQNDNQKKDLAHVFVSFQNYAKLDYIACWFKIASDYILNTNGHYAFVSTNSICQGEQVSLIWPFIFNNDQVIRFAYQSFHWSNNAKDKAGVTCIIVGISASNSVSENKLFIENKVLSVKGISPYLIKGNNLSVYPRPKQLSNIPLMIRGSQPTDNGNLILSEYEKNHLISQYPKSQIFIKKYMGGDDFINDKKRWCLWISDDLRSEAETIHPIQERIEKCKIFRLESNKEATRRKAETAYKFDEIKHRNSSSIIFPIISSVRRNYIPIGFLDGDTVISNKGQVIYDSEPYIFAILTSKMHMLWLSITSSRMRNDYQYSNTLSYNTFPLSDISNYQKQELEKHVYRILEEREAHSEKTLAQLYDPDKMPAGLREAHRQNDLAVERCYRTKPFESDEERLEYLFKLYEQMIATEKEKGTLFEKEKKKRNK